MNNKIQSWFDFIPILGFFIAFKWGGLFMATQVIMALTLLQWIALKIQGKKPPLFQTMGLITVLLFGGMSLLFKHPIFLQLKASVFYLMMATTLFISEKYFKKNIVQNLLQQVLEHNWKGTIPTERWQLFNVYWYSFFLFLAGLNLLVVYFCNTNTWVHFKVFGASALTFIFIVFQFWSIQRYLKKNHDELQTL